MKYIAATVLCHTCGKSFLSEFDDIEKLPLELTHSGCPNCELRGTQNGVVEILQFHCDNDLAAFEMCREGFIKSVPFGWEVT